MDYAFKIEYGNSTTYFEWSAVFGIAGSLIFLIVIIAWFWHLNRVQKNEEWVNATAVLTGQKNTFKQSSFAGGYMHAPAESVEYEIEYFVDGKRYVKWIGVVPSEAKGTKIPIKYNKKHPSRFEEL